MVVDSTINPLNVKLTIEKKVRQKPSMTERTTIEQPPETSGGKKPRKTKKKPSVKKEPKSIVSRDAILIITEKPQAALKIAEALGKAQKYAEQNVPFYEVQRDNKTIIVACAAGHLFSLQQQKGEKGWPIFKMEWVPAHLKKGFTKRYYELIRKLANRANQIIVATDYDIEGEVIGWNIVRFILHRDDAKRMKFSTLTKPELEKAYENPLQTIDWGQAYAGETRHYVDWLYGINLSRALMDAIKKTGSFRILSIGRVQGPALKIIVEREREIADFKSEPFWNVLAFAQDIEFKHPKDIFDKEQLKEFEGIKEGECLTTERAESIEPPYPFDLTSLQREAYAWLKLSPSKTLQIAQQLYLEGLISYPRTSSQKIPKEIEPKKILKTLQKHFKEVAHAKRSVPVEGPKTDPAHPSIYPTGEFRFLDGEVKQLYELIVKRFIAAFAANAEVMRKNITLTANEKDFTANGATIASRGWLEVYPSLMEEKSLPTINGHVRVDQVEFVEKETQPPKRYTPASLITLLEKKNLGTKTTRSLIIDTLFQRGYLDGKSIQATPLGMKLIETLEKHSPIIIDEELTRTLEEKMEELLNTNERMDEKEKNVLIEVERIIGNIAREFKTKESDIGKALLEGSQELREQQKEASIIMQCPKCKKGNLVIKFSKKTQRYFAACDTYPQCNATYSLPPNSLIKKTDKISPSGLPVLVALRKGKRPWEFEFNPNYKPQPKEESSK